MEHSFQGTAAEALAEISRREERCREEIKVSDAVTRLASNPDFQLLMKDFKDISFDMVKCLAYPQSAEAASRTLSGISRFIELIEDYPRKKQQAEAGLVELANNREEVMHAMNAEGEA